MAAARRIGARGEVDWGGDGDGETNAAEDVIAVDPSSAHGFWDTFAAFAAKLHAMQKAAAEVIAVQQQLT